MKNSSILQGLFFWITGKFAKLSSGKINATIFFSYKNSFPEGNFERKVWRKFPFKTINLNFKNIAFERVKWRKQN